MRKLGLILDSTSGLTLDQAQSKGYGFLPMMININGKNFKAGVDINSKQMFDAMKDRSVIIKTASVMGEDIISAFDFALKKFEKAIYIGLSYKFSGTNNAARIIAETEKYKGKIFVYKSQYSAPWTALCIDDFIYLINLYDDDINKIYKALDLQKKYMVGFLCPGDIWWFYKGGRISKMQYIAGSLIKMKPIITIINGEINKDEIPKIRTERKVILKLCEMLKPFVKNIKSKGLPFKYVILKSDDDELNEMSKNVLKIHLQVKNKDIIYSELTTEQNAHMGPGSFGIALLVGIKDILKKEGI